MKIEQSFEIAAPLDQVWDALIDLERVAPCLPGAAITGRDDEGVYRGSFVIKLGPATASYNGTVRVEDIDADSHTATLVAKGTDKRGQGGASATIRNRLTAAGDATRVESVTDMTITGKLARFGRPGMMQDISSRMLKEFASCLQERLQSGQWVGAPEVGTAGDGGGERRGGTVPEGVVAGSAAGDISADLAAEGREASAADSALAAADVAAATPTGAPTGMVGGALSGTPATATTGGMAGAESHRPPGASAGEAASGAGDDAGGGGSSQPQVEAAAPVSALSLGAGVLGDQVKRNPVPVGVAVLLLLLVLLRRLR